MCRRLRYWMVLPLFMSLGFALLAEGSCVGGETPGPEKFGIGHPATPLEVQKWNIDINPDGEGLPKGQGTAQLGAGVYAKHCAGCHGPTGLEGPKPSLVGGQGTLGTPHPAKTVGSYWPYATTLYDYIYRAMPPHCATVFIPRSSLRSCCLDPVPKWDYQGDRRPHCPNTAYHSHAQSRGFCFRPPP